jgi:hypothetical protein
MKYTTVLLLILATACLGSILPGAGVPDVTMLEGDAFSINYADAFDLSHARFPLKPSTNLGKLYGDSIPFQSRDYSAYGVDKLTHTKWVAHNIAALVFDQRKVIIQVIDGNGKLLLKTLFHDFNILKNLYCSGFEYNADRNLVYVGCYGARTQQGPGPLLIATWDLTLEEVTSEISHAQDDGFDIKNSLELKIIHAPQDSNEETYLIAYDQGPGNSQVSRQHKQFRLFRNVAYRQLKFYYLGEIIAHEHEQSIMYDLFPYQGSVLWTGRLEDTQSIISVAQCKLNNGDRQLFCVNPKPTLVTDGYVGFHNEAVMITADIPSRLIYAYQLNGKFTDSSWNTQQIGRVTSVDFFDTEDTWITGAQYSTFGASLNWGTTGYAVEHGVTLVNWQYNYADSLLNKFGFVWNKSFIYGDKETGHAFLLRNLLAELFVAPFQLQVGENPLKITMADKENSRSAQAKITLIQDLHEKVELGTIADSTIASGATGVLPIADDVVISGNELDVSAKSLDENTLTIKDAFYARLVQVTWDGIKNPNGNFFFDGNAAVIETQSSGSRQLIFSTCTQANPASDISCKVHHAVPVAAGNVMGSQIVSLSNGAILAYTTNDRDESTTFIVVNEDSVHQKTHDIQVTDIAGYTQITSGLDGFAVSGQHHVAIFHINPNDIQEIHEVAMLDREHYDVTDFCPTEVRSQKVDKMGWFVILSNCHGGKNYSQEIFTYAVTEKTPQPRLPLSSLDNPTNICAFIGEIIVATNDRVYGVSLKDDWNYWSVPFHELKINRDNFTLSCNEAQNTAVIIAGTEGTQQSTFVNIRGNSGHRQDRRYPHHVQAIDSDRIRTYNFLGSTFHYWLNNEQHAFVQSYLEPQVIIEAKDVTADTKVEVHVTITNGSKTANAVTHVTV